MFTLNFYDFRPEKFLWVYYVPAALFTITSWSSQLLKDSNPDLTTLKKIMAIVTLFRFSFLLPPDSYPARTALLVTVFLCQERIEMFIILILIRTPIFNLDQIILVVNGYG